MGTKLMIKNMVCDRCIMAVQAVLQEMGLQVRHIDLGTVQLYEDNLEPPRMQELAGSLEALGFALIADRKAQIIEAIKVGLIGLIHHRNDEGKVKYSEYLTRLLQLDYPYLSKVFSEHEGITIEQYTIQQKIEKVKEWISYGEWSLSEIAWRLNYSSTAALSSQFKKVTGMTPSAYRDCGRNGRKTLDKVNKPGTGIL
ncbi:helix-turn-helix domain-containing protein [Taibaiella chishuiensis]|uniref:Helix-turn-helix protein n=1 Tax=Taibaiella chishuiensis TaxID=1434707 RepID=A0A2P8D8A5_9BACT|nr:helix-turn-helix transcriptional regulator [Taibaiella chishuiensis]PSK93442.1 helix-turn-helix protein [Taibaiella chishuiensis]